MDKNKKEDKQMEEFLKKQELCKHDEFAPIAQTPVPNTDGQLMLLTTVMCIKCGKPFVQTFVSGITISPVSRPGMPGIFR
jgi:hypothetical protein